jgi:hypothetical protein
LVKIDPVAGVVVEDSRMQARGNLSGNHRSVWIAGPIVAHNHTVAVCDPANPC